MLPVATAIPATVHSYVGDDPPPVVVVLNRTVVPGQIVVPGLAVIITVGVTRGVTTIVTEAVAVVGEEQTALLVIVTLIISPVMGT